MKNAVTRACAWVSLGLLTFGAPAPAQQLDVAVGGGRASDAAASTTPVTPGGSSFGPDGKLYVVNKAHGTVLALDVTNGTATGMPLDPWRSLEYVTDISFKAGGSAYIIQDNRIYGVDLRGGYTSFISGGGYGGRRDCGGSSSFPASYSDLTDLLVIQAGMYTGYLVTVDRGNNNVCLISPYGSSSLLAGSPYGTSGYSGPGGQANYMLLASPTAVAIDPAGNNLYIADTGNRRVRQVTLNSGAPYMTTIVGTGNAGFNGDNIPGYQANLDRPTALGFDAAGNLLIFDSGSQRLRRFANGMVTTVAGNGEHGYSGDGGPAVAAAFSEVESITRAPNGDLYLSDVWNKRVRRISQATGIVDTVLGNGETAFCGDSALPRATCLDAVSGVAVDSLGVAYFSDTNNGRIRRQEYQGGFVEAIAGKGARYGHGGDGSLAIDATFSAPRGLATDAADNLYIATGYDHRIRRIDKEYGTISTIAGTGVGGFSGDGGPAIAAQLDSPEQLVVDSVGNILISDMLNHRVRRIDAATGIITTIAGTGAAGYAGDGGPAINAQINHPIDLALAEDGTIYFTDTENNCIRKVDPAGTMSTVAGVCGPSAGAFSGDGGAALKAEMHHPYGVFVNGDKLYVADTFNSRVRVVNL